MPNKTTEEQVFGSATVALCTSVVFQVGTVNGTEVPVCPKVQQSTDTVDQAPPSGEGRARPLYDLLGEALQIPPWPGNLPQASASVS
jgi:hypothetical protein